MNVSAPLRNLVVQPMTREMLALHQHRHDAGDLAVGGRGCAGRRVLAARLRTGSTATGDDGREAKESADGKTAG